MKRVLEQVIELLNLKQDWDSYGSCPPTEEAAVSALQLIFNIRHIPTDEFRLVPVSGGGIQVEGTISGDEVLISADGLVVKD